MGTRSNIYVETERNGYIGTYCHFDGYPGYMYPLLTGMDKDSLLSLILIAAPRGGFHALEEPETTTYCEEMPCLLTDPDECTWSAEFVWVKCLDGRVKWRYYNRPDWKYTQEDE